mmetsp:Transcript_23171/g.36888  ORF Transcript_23171/g.36888 Transcript_23171/m.36888 type:complete len:113 (-) Transcript_23171:223-561(-)
MSHQPTDMCQHVFLDKCKNHDWPAVKKMVQADPKLARVSPKGRWSALHQFASIDDAVAVRFLLAKGADPVAKNKKGETSLDVATGSCIALLQKAIDKADTRETPRAKRRRTD